MLCSDSHIDNDLCYSTCWTKLNLVTIISLSDFLICVILINAYNTKHMATFSISASSNLISLVSTLLIGPGDLRAVLFSNMTKNFG